jgi:hypothetical protein
MTKFQFSVFSSSVIHHPSWHIATTNEDANSLFEILFSAIYLHALESTWIQQRSQMNKQSGQLSSMRQTCDKTAT